MKTLLVMLLFCLLLPTIGWSLDYQERVRGHLLNISENRKRVVLNIGIEDGVVEGDQVRVLVNQYELATAICVVVRVDRSEWFFIRNPHPLYWQVNQAVELVSQYGPGQRPRIKNLDMIRRDSLLMQDLQSERQSYLAQKQQQVADRKKRIYQIYQIQQARQVDLPDLIVQLKLAPFSLKSPGGQRNMAYGAEVKKLDDREDDFKLFYNYSGQIYRGTVPAQGSYQASEYHAGLEREKKGAFGPQWHYVGLLELKRAVDNGVEPIASQLWLAPVALRHPFTSAGGVKGDILYAPAYEFFSGDQLDLSTVGTSPYRQKQTAGVMHLVRSEWSYNFDTRTQMVNWVQWHGELVPNSRTMGMQMGIKLGYELFPQVSLNVLSRMDIEKRRSTYLEQSSTQWENRLYLYYTRELKQIKF